MLQVMGMHSGAAAFVRLNAPIVKPEQLQLKCVRPETFKTLAATVV